MLSLQDCKWLASVGMEIIVQPGDYVHENELYDDEHAYRIPSLTELMEWFREQVYCEICICCDSCTRGWNARAHYQDGSYDKEHADTPEAALVALIRKLREERDDG